MLNAKPIAAGTLSALMACTGGAVLIISSAQAAGLSRPELVSWLFVVYFVGGLINLLMSLIYKLPIAGAHSITSAAFLSLAAAHYSLPELAGGFLMAGGLIAVLGFSGLLAKVFQWIPRPLLDAMLAGMILHYAVDVIPALGQSPIAGVLAILGFFVAPRISPVIPPLLGVLVFGVAGLLLEHEFPALPPAVFTLPGFIVPEFTSAGFVSLAIPIAVLVLSNDLAVALAALKKNGFQAPFNKLVAGAGLGTVLVSFFGGHAVTMGGMMTALCSSEEAGPREGRFRAAVVSGVLVMIFGLFAWKVAAVIELVPRSFIAVITGFSLIGVLLNSMKSAFSEVSYRYSVLFAFVIAISNVEVFGISAAVWSLLIGTVTAKLLREGPAPSPSAGS
ncbi:benzoate membrane transport protein [Paenibacillus sp. UNCCL117]|uniref:benzoate/H(+) symporter BenE family transporter n=1 Tax=unclassified Paenibacillus TaxID=185978 RepID=UPI00088887F5|nr:MULTISPECIES: benzoate/H(+) symporter BenE family transporter [unclassified Paenibacillus]SDC92731.1 benzoate membrane transport protein [Paenibacillus sp. cl123]SFW29402.1 benzoate membrane transport protein [Paenibacillus sp. UNCCL117]